MSLRRAYPEARIDWLVNAAFTDAVRHHPLLDGVVPFDRRRKAAVLPLLRRLRRARYDTAYDFQGLARSGLFTWATRAPVRVGSAQAAEAGWLGYNRRHRVDPARHAVDRMLALLDAQGVPRVDDLTLYVGDEDRQSIDADLATRGLAPGRYACVAPTAQWGCKCWPLERYAQLTQRLLEQPGLDHVFVLAAPHERPRVEAGLTAALTPTQREHTRTPPTTVGRLMALIQSARLLVCNDSAPLHLAVGLDTPTVSLFGPTDPALTGPPPEVLGTRRSPNNAWADPRPDPVPAANTLLAARGHRVLRAPSAVGQTFNYRQHRDDPTLIAELSFDTVWAAVQDALRAAPDRLAPSTGRPADRASAP
ncbi:MAG: glycosyltransferase family 9 protein [Planctomycetota bacterium]